MLKYSKFAVILVILFSIKSFAKPLDISQLKEFNSLILEETKDSPEKIFKYLADELIVETHIGSSVNGMMLSFNKNEYITLIQKNMKDMEGIKDDKEIDVFNFNVISSNKGEFTMMTYSKSSRRSVWSTFTVALIQDKMQIVKIVEST